MAQAIHAIYEDGHLSLLDPVELAEGAYVDVTIATIDAEALTLDQRMRTALGSSVRFSTPREKDQEAEPAWVPLKLTGGKTVSEYIIQERREGP